MPILMILISRYQKLQITLLEIFGRSSYNIFLTQMVWYAYGAGIIEKYAVNRFFCLYINMIICLGVGVFFYYFEVPITRRISKKIYNLKSVKAISLH